MHKPEKSLPSLDRLTELLVPYMAGPPESLLLRQLSAYLALLVKWNERTNLTAIRDPEEMVRRHFGESLFAASAIPVSAGTLLDLGSGAGFPGIPMLLARPGLKVTLAESQNKKAAFLREAARVLELPLTVHGERAETLCGRTSFDVVALRAVDDPEAALSLAGKLVSPGGAVLHLTTEAAAEPEVAEAVTVLRIPGTQNGVVRVLPAPMFHVEH